MTEELENAKNGSMGYASLEPVHVPSTVSVDEKYSIRWRVALGDRVSKGELLAYYAPSAQISQPSAWLELRAPCSGIVHAFLVNSGECTAPRERVALLNIGCPHHIVVKNMCAECGSDLASSPSVSTESASSRVAMVHGETSLLVSQPLAEKMALDDESRLLYDRKLSLIVDLDQTLVHATTDDRSPWVAAWLTMEEPERPKNIYRFHLVEASSHEFFVKLRPGIEEFLERMDKLYEMHVYTMGTRAYAHAVVTILDPTRKYFGRRILSRDDSLHLLCPGTTAKRSKHEQLRHIFPAGDSMVVMMDDREDVWRGCDNLVLVSPYVFFEEAGDLNAFDNVPRSRLYDEEQESAKVPDDRGDSFREGTREQFQVNKLTEPLDGAKVLSIPDEPGSTEGVQVSVIAQTNASDAVSDLANISPANEVVNDTENEGWLRVAALALAAAETVAKKPITQEAQQAHVMAMRRAIPRLPDTEAEAQLYLANLLRMSYFERAFQVLNTWQRIDVKFFGGRRVRNVLLEILRTNIPMPISDKDRVLMDMATVLEDIHREYYAGVERKARKTTASLVKSRKHRTLRGVHIVFSGVIPLSSNVSGDITGSADYAHNRSEPEEHPLWRAAESFGAVCWLDIVDGVTHVVAARPGTKKVEAALRNKDGLYLVHVSWLHACIASWHHVAEEGYSLNGLPVLSEESRALLFANESGNDRMTSFGDATPLDHSSGSDVLSNNISPRLRRRTMSEGSSCADALDPNAPVIGSALSAHDIVEMNAEVDEVLDASDDDDDYNISGDWNEIVDDTNGRRREDGADFMADSADHDNASDIELGGTKRRRIDSNSSGASTNMNAADKDEVIGAWLDELV